MGCYLDGQSGVECPCPVPKRMGCCLGVGFPCHRLAWRRRRPLVRLELPGLRHPQAWLLPAPLVRLGLQEPELLELEPLVRLRQVPPERLGLLQVRPVRLALRLGLQAGLGKRHGAS